MAFKMRVLYYSKSGKMAAMAGAIAEKYGAKLDDIPPAYPCDKERLVIIVMSLKGDPSDKLRLFCSELNATRAYNVALVVDNKEQERGIKKIKDTLRDAGTNVIDDVYYVKAGFLSGSKITLEERTAIVKWAEGVISKLDVK